MSEYCYSQKPVVHIAIFLNQTRSGSLDNYTLSCEGNMCEFVELCICDNMQESCIHEKNQTERLTK